ncbi:MotA/TolQ/ExbB proton channel family protein [Salinarimonas sp.]|uniref:MotA/TolQ/ExbB proton channel family protein n=1 Tax=Salinarimonas sp. TaxID=2766526 RepID=UPI0032D95E68
MNEEFGTADAPPSTPETPPASAGEGSQPADAPADAAQPARQALADGAAEGAPALADAPGGVTERALELLQVGGPVVAVLLALSVVALAIVLVKLMQFRALGLGDRTAAREGLALWRAGREAQALERLRGARNPVAQALIRAIRGQRRGLPEAKVREEVVRYGRDVLAALRSWFRPLEVIASLAPLLGLFGTVLGMIEAFRQLEAAGNQVDPAILSGGIWEALLTTAVGLAVAMPVVVVLNWLERKVDRLALEMDSVVTRVFTHDLSEDADPADEDAIHEPARFRSAVAAGE